MKNYVIHRIACTLQLLVFFLATMRVDPETVMGRKGFLDKSQAQDDWHKIPKYFPLPVMATVLITIVGICLLCLQHCWAELLADDRW